MTTDTKESPERIWVCYDPEYDATYWAGPDRPYSERDLIGEYARADLLTAAQVAKEAAAALADARDKALEEAAQVAEALDPEKPTNWLHRREHIPAAIRAMKGKP